MLNADLRYPEREDMSQARRTIALIGGGRWARVHASNLATLLFPSDQVLWVSRHNQSQQQDVVERLPKVAPGFELLSDVEGLFEARPSAAVIVTAADTHASMARVCLERGLNVFVEKPLAFKATEAKSLVAIAAKADLVLALGAHLLSASYLSHFKEQLAGRAIVGMSIRWFDPADEVRHGESKRVDDRTPLAHDVYPHIWSLVERLTGCGEPHIVTASKAGDGSIAFKLSANATDVDVQCGRHMRERERKIVLVLKDGEASIDFTEEPGRVMFDGIVLPSDPLWGKTLRPVMAEVARFLGEVSSVSRDAFWPHLAANCLGSVSGAEALFSKLEGF
jgi:predicted dehydrogenase